MKLEASNFPRLFDDIYRQALGGGKGKAAVSFRIYRDMYRVHTRAMNGNNLLESAVVGYFMRETTLQDKQYLSIYCLFLL